MKKTILAIFSMIFLIGTISAQTGIKALKKATKEANKYTANLKENGDRLENAFKLIDVAFEDEEVKTSPKAWNMKGAIYNKIASSEMNASLLPGGDTKLAHENAALLAYESYKKALEVSGGKGKYFKAALTGFMEAENHLNNVGITAFQNKEYPSAFKNFDAGIEIYNVLKANKKKSRIDVDTIREEHIFYTAVSAFYGDMKDMAIPYFEQNLTSSSPKSLSFDALYQIYASKDENKALDYLSKGREAFPDDTGLLFTEINHYLKAGKLEQLIAKLKKAIEIEPDNVSVYITMGNVFDQLHVKETEAGNTEKAKEHFESALSYYNQSLEKDKDNFDAIYSIGTLYYNKAANMTHEINKLNDDFSKAGMAKYKEASKKMDDTFVLSLPYFEKARTINPVDLNTLIALKEIYARQDKLTESEALKVEIEKIRAKN